MADKATRAPTKAEPKQKGPPPTAVPPPKPKLSKAERRELQEKQRAAKSEAAAAGPSTKPGPAKQKPQKPSADAPPFSVAASQQGAAAPSRRRSFSSSTGPGAAHDIRSLHIFSHFGLPKSSSHGIKGDIHPAIVRLALQFSEFKIVGANARCIATLTAFKTLIQEYQTPPQITLSRHLMTYLSPQISYLVSAGRPMSVSMGNAIRHLKYEISILDIDMPEQDAKNFLCERINHFIRDRIVVADQVIQQLCLEKIHNGDIVLTYARSSVVEKALLEAHQAHISFSVIVVDSLPLGEAKHLLHTLTSAGIPTTYITLPALPSILSSVTTVLLGAHALHSNGALFSRAGTALVAMMARSRGVPVLVCCETYKFSDGVSLDSFTKNELAPAPKKSPNSTNPPNLHVLSPLYDLTPPSNITAVVTEVGLIPPSSVPMVISGRGLNQGA